MTEKEYIDATNLAKVRAAMAVLRDVLPMTPAEEKELRACTRPLSAMQDRLTKIVKCEPA